MNTAVVLGGSGGIGQEIISVLLKNQIRVINIDREKSKIEDKLLIDVSCRLNETNMFGEAKKLCREETNIDYFISTIGYYEARGKEGFTPKYFKDMLETNLMIPAVFTNEITRKMELANCGKIILILSAAAYIGSRDLAYSVSKSGEVGIVHGIAKGSKGRNVYIYGIAPGIVETNMSSKMSEARKLDAINGTLQQKICTPEEVADMVEYIVLKDKGYMSGSIIHMNNGLYFN